RSGRRCGRRDACEPHRNTAHDHHYNSNLDIGSARDNRFFGHLGFLRAFGLCRIGSGGTQATARSYMAIEAPEGKTAEFFGFMTFSTKIAAIFGPLLYGTISSRTDNPRIALLSLEVLFILGLIF